MVVVRKALVILVTGTLGYSGAAFGQQSLSSNDPPSRVGRLAFTEGTVSFHDAERTDWEGARINTPLTTGDAVWTEPDAHAEISIAGTRVRMDGATQLDLLTLDDKATRLQLDQGRVDIKTFTYDAKQPYDLVTPRGIVTLQQQGDYYVEAGSTEDPTRLGVRAGAAQFQAPDGRVLAVRAGEVAEITGDGSTMELHTIPSPPPPMPQYWAARDKQVVYDQPPQYLSASVTGYEDLNTYGTWQNDPEYGRVWYVRDAPSGWAPYTTGHWDYQPVYGWTWIDDQPWGFAPYHYGRWAHRNNRWFWVPPERSRPAVYAPALVAFVGGTELGLALGMQNRQPVGWFPLGPREAYVPPYTTNRDYYRRLNYSARVQDRILEDRWQRTRRHEAVAQQQNWMNRRFTTVVPAETFARSQPVQRAAIRVSADKVAAAPVAAVAAPPQPTQSIRALMAPANTAAPNSTQRPSTPTAPTAPNAAGKAGAGAQANVATLAAIKPDRQVQKAPGPQIMSRSAVTASPSDKASTDAKAALPKLEPRNASAPPPPQIKGERKPATLQAGPQQATAPANQPAPKPAEPPKPGEPNRAQPRQPGQATLPPVRDRNEPPKPGQPPRASTQPNTATPNVQPPKPGEPPKPPQAQTAPKPGEPPKSPSAPAQQAAPQPPKAEPPKPPQAHTTPQAPKPPQAMSAPPRQAEPPKSPQPHQATPPAPQPQQLKRQPSAPPQQQTHAAPPPQPQRQAAPPPQMQHHVPAPPPQPQRQAAPPQMQHHAPPPPQRQAAPPPRPAPPPQQAQQAPRPQPQAKPQQPPPQQGQHKPDEKR
jgi:hypothetical protein